MLIRVASLNVTADSEIAFNLFNEMARSKSA